MDDIENNPTIRKLLHELEQLKARVAAAETKQREYLSPFGRVLIVRRDGTTGGTWKEQAIVAGEVVEFVDGRQAAEGEEAELMNLAGAEVAIEFEDDGCHRYATLQSLFRVTLEEDGDGADGTASTPATYTYTASINGQTIGEGVAPAWERENGRRVAATEGYCEYSSGGSLLLTIHNERKRTTTC
jgi:hypothetical protein